MKLTILATDNHTTTISDVKRVSNLSTTIPNDGLYYERYNDLPGKGKVVRDIICFEVKP